MERKRTKQIVIRLSDYEFSLMKSRVAWSGLTQADYLRKCMLNKRIVSTAYMIPLTRELNQIGVNLNQIAKQINQKESPIYDDILYIIRELEKTRNQIRYFIEQNSSSVFDEIREIREELNDRWLQLNQFLIRVEQCDE